MSSSIAPVETVSDRWNRVFQALSEQPRRCLILSLADEPPDAMLPLPEAALSDHYDGSRRDLDINLRHQHLPVLDDAGYVVWDETRFRAARGPNFEEVAAVLTTLVESADDLPDTLVEGCAPLEQVAGIGQP